MRSFQMIGSVFSAMTAIIALVATACAAGGSDELPRYRLKVGQELKYQGKSDFKYDNGSLAYQNDWTFWVVRANTDGSWRVIGRSSSRTSQTMSGQKAHEMPADVTIAYFDLLPDGRVVANKTFGYRFDPSGVFLRLPNDAEQAKSGWVSRNERDSKTTEFKHASTDGSHGDEWAFDAVDHGIWDKIYLMSSHARNFFDLKKGLVKRIESENTQDYGFHGKGTGTVTLTAMEELNPEQIKALDQESARYFAANQKYEDLTTEAGKDAEHVKDLLAKAETTLKDAKDSLTLPDLRTDRRAVEKAQADGVVLYRGSPKPKRRPGQAWRRLGDQGPRRQDTFAQGLQGKGRHPRLLVQGLRLVYPGHAPDERTRRRLQGPTGGRPWDEHRQRGEGCQVRR